MQGIAVVERGDNGNELSSYLLAEIKHQPQQPVNSVPAMPVAEKQFLIDRLQTYLSGRMFLDKFHLRWISGRINEYNTGTKRVSVHASRKKFADADLALIHALYRSVQYYPFTQVLLYAPVNLKYWGYKASQYFCCDYKNYRLASAPEDAPRVRKIARFFEADRKRKMEGGCP